MTQPSVQETGVALHALGLNVTAVAAGGKGPIYRWKDQPSYPARQTLTDVCRLPWEGYISKKTGKPVPAADSVGIINGPDGCGGARAFDIDAVERDGTRVPVSHDVPLLMTRVLGLPDDYPWLHQSKSGTGWHLHIRCPEELPEAALTEKADEKGVFVGYPHYGEAFDHIELRWTGVQTLFGGPVPPTPPALVSIDQIVAAFHAVARSSPLEPAQPPTSKTKEATYRSSLNGQASVIDAFNTRYTIESQLVASGYQFNDHDDRYAAPGHREGSVKIKEGKSFHHSHHDKLKDGYWHSAFDVYCQYNHRGDSKEAVKAAARLLGLNESYTSDPNIDPVTGLPWSIDQVVSSSSRIVVGNTLAQTDLGNAERLVARHGKNLRYVPAWGHWLIWDGRCWRKDETGGVNRLAIDTVKAMYAEAAQISDTAERKALANWARTSESRGRLEAMIAIAQFLENVPVHFADLDNRPYLLNCRNGTINLQTGTLQPHNRNDMLTRRIDVDYDPHALAPIWKSFIVRITNGDIELQTCLQLSTGYTLTGSVVEQCLFFCYGSGSNGKTTFVEVLRNLMSDFWLKAPTEMLMVQQNGGGIPNDIARLPGARMVVASEISQGRRFDEAKVKDLTGGDTIVARFMRQEFFEFQPVFKLWIYGNHKPVIRGTDNGIWRRLRVLPFTAVIGEEEKDPNLPAKLRAELPGILAWAVRGCLEWQRNGLLIPEIVKKATENYRNEMDVIGEFLNDCCVVSSQVNAQAGALYKAYTKWCEDGGENAVNQRLFGLQLTERGMERFRSNGQNRWRGVGLRIPIEATDITSDPLESMDHSAIPHQEATSTQTVIHSDPESGINRVVRTLMGDMKNRSTMDHCDELNGITEPNASVIHSARRITATPGDIGPAKWSSKEIDLFAFIVGTYDDEWAKGIKLENGVVVAEGFTPARWDELTMLQPSDPEYAECCKLFGQPVPSTPPVSFSTDSLLKELVTSVDGTETRSVATLPPQPLPKYDYETTRLRELVDAHDEDEIEAFIGRQRGPIQKHLRSLLAEWQQTSA